jgi:hypothetical protein
MLPSPSGAGKKCRRSRAMAQGFSARTIAVFILGTVVATVLTVMGTFYVLHTVLLDDPADPLTKQGGLKREQKISR